MKIRIWGCRGSIPTPGPATLRYGGNTTCLEVRSASGQVIIVDAGSGLRNLGAFLSRETGLPPIRFFFTHAHWDHLAGFPFFQPAYSAKTSITMCSGPHAQELLKGCLTDQMKAPYFPVDFRLLRAKFDFRCERPHGEPGHCRLDGLEICPIALSHPNGGYGYKFIEPGKTFVFLTDNELGFRHEGGLDRGRYADFCRGTDLLVHDAQYTEEEYEVTRGWGHSTFADAADLAIEAGVRRLGIFHHDPGRADDDLDRRVELCRERIRRGGSNAECLAIAEGMVIDL
ncbi:MAG: MBL fold metallo-hydrolase [Gemmatimonadota bacterium]